MGTQRGLDWPFKGDGPSHQQEREVMVQTAVVGLQVF